MDWGAGIFSGLVGLCVLVFAVVFMFVWVFLPFAVFGIKERLDTVIVELRKLRAAIEPRVQASADERLSARDDFDPDSGRRIR